MGFFELLGAIGQAAGVFTYYNSIYDAYDDEDLVDEFVRLWKLKYNLDSSEDDELRLSVVKLIIDKRKLFDLDD
ncbi:hypothetical protein [uncultured Ruminococcus sp.]|uniref:hypothetical protein n=1 Tax=uncultured Ruminococcus sp. TaxID=165186 RepID=UPI0025F5D34E|nr:hypothetical protein [uncultured Ruminococcus sp.]